MKLLENKSEKKTFIEEIEKINSGCKKLTEELK